MSYSCNMGKRKTGYKEWRESGHAGTQYFWHSADSSLYPLKLYLDVTIYVIIMLCYVMLSYAFMLFNITTSLLGGYNMSKIKWIIIWVTINLFLIIAELSWSDGHDFPPPPRTQTTQICTCGPQLMSKLKLCSHKTCRTSHITL